MADAKECRHCAGVARPGRATCVRCAAAQATAYARRRAALAGAGLCLECGSGAPEPGRTRCLRCLARHVAWDRAYHDRTAPDRDRVDPLQDFDAAL